MTHVLEFSYMYPSPRNPNSGVFIERQVRELSRMVPLDVVSPVPWAPRVLFDTRVSWDLGRGHLGPAGAAWQLPMSGLNAASFVSRLP